MLDIEKPSRLQRSDKAVVVLLDTRGHCLFDALPRPDYCPPEGLEERHEETAADHHAHGQAGLTVPVEDGVDVVVTTHRTGGLQGVQAGVGGQVVTPRHANPHPACRPVNHGENRVVNTEYDDQVEMMDADGSRREVSFNS